MGWNRGKIGPYSRRLRRGAIGGLIEIDGRSAEGRFVRHLEAEITAHVGGDPSIIQKLLIERLIKIRCQLDRLDESSMAAPGPITTRAHTAAC